MTKAPDLTFQIQHAASVGYDLILIGSVVLGACVIGSVWLMLWLASGGAKARHDLKKRNL